jgi:hypothetical protein
MDNYFYVIDNKKMMQKTIKINYIYNKSKILLL